MPLILLLKLLLVPSLIYAVTLVGRRWGPGVAGWMSAFPIVSGPILLTVTLEQGAAFAACPRNLPGNRLKPRGRA